MNVASKNKIAAFFFVLFTFLLDCSHQVYAQAYGLTFLSYEVVQEKRTSLDLTGNEPVCFSRRLDLSFELGFVPDHVVYFGYVFRLINDKDQNIDLIFDQKKQLFRLVSAETFTDIEFGIDDNTLQKGWTTLRFSIDPAKDRIFCSCNGKVWQSKPLGLKSHCFRVFFGACNEHNFISWDLPPMRLRNIGLRVDGIARNSWPLNESAGARAEDTISHKTALVSNPEWIKPRHEQWAEIKTLAVHGQPSVAFDPVSESLFVVSSDSLYTMQVRNAELVTSALSSVHTNLLDGNQSIYNPDNKKLYNFFADQKTVSTYDTSSHRWNRNFGKGEITEFWQANKFIANDSALYVIGGYGQLKYKNLVQRYSFATNSWSILQPKGDFFAPRYLAALGTTTSTDTAYIIGGYGSKEGDQLLNPRYFYDFLLYDVQRNRFRKLYSLAEPEKHFVFANSIILDSNRQNYYALIFPNDRFNSSLQLIKGSLTRPAYTLLGKPFPYLFNDVKSFADLYYCKRNNSLLAVTLYTDKDNVTEIKIYRIGFPVNDPPIEFLAAQTVAPVHTALYAGIAAGVLLAGVFGFLFLKKRKSRKQLAGRQERQYEQTAAVPFLQESQLALQPEAEVPSRREQFLQPQYPVALEKTGPLQAATIAAAVISEAETGADILAGAPPPDPRGKITLFGGFAVSTADGKNITRQFTPLLKEMFLLILIDSLRYKKGVTAEKLNDILWNDKDIKDAKNNRSVNLVKLKNILDHVGGCGITRETGAWKFECDPALVNIDLVNYLDILSHPSSVHQPAVANRLLGIVETGAFLPEAHYEWLDTLKAEISNFVIESLLYHVRSLDVSKDAEKVITISNAIFSFDELNEHALMLHCKSLVALGRHTLAKNTFDKFRLKYKDIYGEEFRENYHSLIS